MNYRSVNDLRRTILRELHRVPEDVDAIVGIPRSGLLPALLIGLYKHLPVTDIESFLANRPFSTGRRLGRYSPNAKGSFKSVLVIDDSIVSGRQMAAARSQLEAANPDVRAVYVVVYGDRKQHAEADIVMEQVPTPRVFEWNIMHGWATENACLDMDGVICRDPAPEDTASAAAYERFLSTCEPNIIPRSHIGWIVTSRLETARGATMEWLDKHGVKYGELVMWDTKLKKRASSAQRARYKADVFCRLPSNLFIESDRTQARLIARWSGKPVFCMATQELVTPLSPAGLRRRLMEKVNRLRRRVRRQAARRWMRVRRLAPFRVVYRDV